MQDLNCGEILVAQSKRNRAAGRDFQAREVCPPFNESGGLGACADFCTPGGAGGCAGTWGGGVVDAAKKITESYLSPTVAKIGKRSKASQITMRGSCVAVALQYAILFPKTGSAGGGFR